MILDLAQYFSGVAELVGIVHWSSNERYIPAGALEETYAFQFDGIGNLPHLLEKANPTFVEKIKYVVDDEHNIVTLY